MIVYIPYLSLIFLNRKYKLKILKEYQNNLSDNFFKSTHYKKLNPVLEIDDLRISDTGRAGGEKVRVGRSMVLPVAGVNGIDVGMIGVDIVARDTGIGIDTGDGIIGDRVTICGDIIGVGYARTTGFGSE